MSRPTDDDRADDVVAEVQSRLERGEPVDLAAVLERHADLYDRLAPRLAALRLLAAAYASLGSVVPGAAGARLAPGARLGPYRLEAVLARGGMGTVYRAVVEEDGVGLPRGSPVAVKVVDTGLAARELEARLVREAAAGRRVRHENVVATLGAATTTANGTRVSYVATELVEGETIRQVLLREGPLPETRVLDVAAQLVRGLVAIHAEAIVHRDLKPENVVITPEGRARIMDLGLARLLDASASLTAEGQFAGSVAYAAPEQLRGERVGPAADLFALGVLLFELLSGAHPWGERPLTTRLAAGAAERPAPELASETGVSPFLAAVVGTLLAPSPDDRFSSAAVLARLLEEGTASSWWTARVEAERRDAACRPARLARPAARLCGRAPERRVLAEAARDLASHRGAAWLFDGESGAGVTHLLAAWVDADVPSGVDVLYGDFSTRPGVGAVASALGGAAEPACDAAPLVDEVRRRATARPTVLVLEHVEAADRDGRALAERIASVASGVPLLLVLTAATHAGARASLPPARAHRLPRLGRRVMEEILSDLGASAWVEGPVARRLLSWADGLPGTLVEIARGLEAAGRFARDDEGRLEVVAPFDDDAPPAEVRRLAEARLLLLRTEERDLLDLASVVGTTFCAGELARALGRANASVLRDLARVERRTGIVVADAPHHRFAHRLDREALLADLAPEARTAYRALLASPPST